MKDAHLAWIFIFPSDPQNSVNLTQQYPLTTADSPTKGAEEGQLSADPK